MALMNSAATIYSLDVYRRLLNPAATDAQLVRVGRFASVLSLIIATLLCPFVANLGGIFVFFQTCVTYLATPFVSVIRT